MGMVTLLTDFGLQDDYVGLLHASIGREDPAINVIDLCNDIEPGNLAQAAFLVLKDSDYFPGGTVFVIVVDPGVGTDRRVLVVEHDRSQAPGGRLTYVAPDNGLLDPLIQQLQQAGETVRVYAASTEDVLEKLSAEADRPMPAPSVTFHGRDVFAPLGAKLAGGGRAEAYASPADDWTRHPWRPPVQGDEATLGRVMYADHFGNLITDIPVDGTDGQVVILSRTLPRVHTFADIAPGEIAWLRGSKGTVEIVMNGQSAAAMLRTGKGETVVLSPL